MNLFQIEEAILRCVKLEEPDKFVDTETGEIIDIAALTRLEMQKDKKIRNIACWIRNLDAYEEALKKQEDIFKARKTATKNKKESLKRYLSNFLMGEKWENEEVKISWRKSDVVEIQDTKLIPEKYLKYQEPEIDRAGIKKALKAGEEIKGAVLVNKNNIQIK